MKVDEEEQEAKAGAIIFLMLKVDTFVVTDIMWKRRTREMCEVILNSQQHGVGHGKTRNIMEIVNMVFSKDGFMTS